MSKVEFIYSKGGKKVKMATRTAEALRKMGYGTYQTRMLTAGTPAPAVEEPKASAAIAEFAKENGVDIEKVVGTGKDGRIKKSDVEAVIDARDLT
ncbi:dihydrolipoamide acetyltransferase [compost metagenome]